MYSALQPVGKDAALSGLRVLDITGEMGMFCTRLLTDLGAEVLKIEKPGGDDAREIGPFVHDVPNPEMSLYFWFLNTGKKSLTLNIESNAGQEILHRLLETTDVLVETFLPGYMDSLSLGYASLSKHYPRLIMTSITPFGQTGPRRGYKSCNLVASALGGQMYVCGDSDTPPLKPYGEQSCFTASLFGAVGTLIALHYRHLSGRGQHIDISLQECVASTLEHVNVLYMYEGIISQRQGTLHWNGEFRLFPCKDGYILLSLFREWDTLVEWLDSEGMAADLKEIRWLNVQLRLQEIDHIIEVVERWTKRHTAAELVEQAQLMHLPWAEVASMEKLAGNPQLKERGFFVEVEHPELSSCFTYAGAPFKLSHTPWRISRRAPLIGEHNEEIYCGELGFSPHELAALRTKGVI